jgi:hypothetical protein
MISYHIISYLIFFYDTYMSHHFSCLNSFYLLLSHDISPYLKTGYVHFTTPSHLVLFRVFYERRRLIVQNLFGVKRSKKGADVGRKEGRRK